MAPSRRIMVRGGAFLVAGAVVQAVSGFLAQLVLMRLLLPEDFGLFTVIVAAAGLVQMLLSLRVNALIIRTPEREMTPVRREILHSAIVAETCAAGVAMIAWLALSGAMSWLALAAILALALGQWTNQVAAFAERGMPYRLLAVAETAGQVSGHVVAVGLVLGGFGAGALYVRELVAALVRLGLLAWRGAIALEPCRLLSWPEWKALLREARDLWCDGVLESGFSRLMVLAGGFVGGLHGAGIFSQANRLALVPHQILAPVAGRMAANVFSRQEERGPRLRILTGMLSLAGVPLLAAAALTVGWADPLVPWLFGEQWRPAAGVLAAMAGVVLFYTLFEVIRAYCLTQRLSRYILAGRVLQYGVFAAGAVWAVRCADPVTALGLAASAAFAVAFLCPVLLMVLAARR